MARTAKRFNALEKEKPQELMATAAKTYRTGLYGRLSSEKGNRPSDSIDNQLAIMKNFIKLHPEFSDYKVYTDSGFTGTNFNRPAFTQLMDDVRAGRINCIIVKDLSRFGRDYLETTNYIEVILPFLDVRLISVNDHFDTDEKSNGNKELEVTLKNLVNDMYAKDISKKISSTVQQNMESGKNLCSHAPYGYVIDRDDPMRRLYPNKDTAPILREIFQMVADGKTLGKVAGILYEWRINSPGDYLKTGKVYFEDDEEGHLWISSTLSRMLKNEVYLGHLAQGKKRARLYNNEKEHRVSKTEWVIVENVHEPIIPENLFHEVGKILNGKWNRTLEIRKNNAQFPQKEDRYGGLVYCACCGRRMYFTSHINRKDEEKPYREYMYSCMQRGVHRGGKAASIMKAGWGGSSLKWQRLRSAGLRTRVSRWNIAGRCLTKNGGNVRKNWQNCMIRSQGLSMSSSVDTSGIVLGRWGGKSTCRIKSIVRMRLRRLGNGLQRLMKRRQTQSAWRSVASGWSSRCTG